jgi:hypothetical protein
VRSDLRFGYIGEAFSPVIRFAITEVDFSSSIVNYFDDEHLNIDGWKWHRRKGYRKKRYFALKRIGIFFIMVVESGGKASGGILHWALRSPFKSAGGPA